MKIFVIISIFFSTVVSCQNTKKNQRPAQIIGEEFREYQYTKEVWALERKSSSGVTQLYSLAFLNANSIFRVNFLNEVTKVNPDIKHVYFWEDKAQKVAFKMVVHLGDSMNEVKLRWDVFSAPPVMHPEEVMSNQSYRLQSFYELKNRIHLVLSLDKIHKYASDQISQYKVQE